MDPTIINQRCQEFRGTRYYLCGKYFTRNGDLLHRAVWAFNNSWAGIPKGFHVHHKDHDRANNRADNLELVEASAHLSRHHTGHSRAITLKALQKAAGWHGSDEGKIWHRGHYAKNADLLHVIGEFQCVECGAPYNAQINGRNKFCSNNCKTRYRRRSKVDDAPRNCVVCGVEFISNKYSKTKTCGSICHGVLSGRSRRGASKRGLLPDGPKK